MEELLVLNGLEEERVLYDEERGSCHWFGEGYPFGGGELDIEIEGVVVKRWGKMHEVVPLSGQFE